MAKIRTNNSPPIHLGSPFDTSGADDADRPPPSNTLADALLLAMANGQLRLHYQPIIDVATDRITGLEALLRWEHPAWGTLSPRRFIAVAEQSGLMADIDDWVIRRACQDLRSWADSDCTGVRVEINISTSQFRDPLLADKIRDALSEWRIDPHMLSLEMTEAALMGDTVLIAATLRQLKELGIGLTIDDYGSGFLSLADLQRFPLDRIKIGRLLVRDMVEEADDAAILNAIASSAHRYGMRVCAEGVESDIQCKLLCEHLCDEMQGHLFYRALPANGIAIEIKEGKALADHLARLQVPQRTLLLVDDETNILAALKRMMRRDNYQILTAGGGQEALDVLGQHEVGVIVSDQRMPGMTGTEFLHIAKDLYPDTMRIVLSGFTELQSVTDAVNEGAIYKFLIKPWDDEQLRGHVAEAFRHKEIADENRRLKLHVRIANQQLEEVLRQKQLEIQRDEMSLGIVREAMRHVPMPVIGLDDDEVVAFVNIAAESLFGNGGSMLGCDARQAMPELMSATRDAGDGEMCIVALGGGRFQVAAHGMGKGSASRGKLLTLMKQEGMP